MFAGSAKRENKAAKQNDEGLRGVGGILILKSQGDAGVKTGSEESHALTTHVHLGQGQFWLQERQVQEPGGGSPTGQPRISVASVTGVNGQEGGSWSTFGRD